MEVEGMLYVCATPIGNLKDITLRCLEVLELVDIIAAEDTRHTIKLLNYYNIKSSLLSYHEHNKETKGQKIISMLKDGKDIALVSDAGMPAISDPGQDLIKLCYENNIKVTVLPGASASITALVLSGMKTRSYCFEGFLPSNKKCRKNVLDKIKKDDRTYILYEAPHKLIKTLDELYEYIGNREVAIVKELTKKFENILKVDLIDAISYFKIQQPKGEYVIILNGAKHNDIITEEDLQFENISIQDEVNMYIKKEIDIKDAMKKVAKRRNISKREVYALVKINNK